jgi:hypothetical protein
MKRHSIARWWADYAEKVLPAHAPAVQKQETRRAFYAGAAAMLDAIVGGLEGGEDATEGDLAHMDDLQRELLTFAADVKAGRA